jgi:hypothetical protein
MATKKENLLARAVAQLENAGYVCFGLSDGNTVAVLARKNRRYRFYRGTVNSPAAIAAGVEVAPVISPEDAAVQIGRAVLGFLFE